MIPITGVPLNFNSHNKVQVAPASTPTLQPISNMAGVQTVNGIPQVQPMHTLAHPSQTATIYTHAHYGAPAAAVYQPATQLIAHPVSAMHHPGQPIRQVQPIQQVQYVQPVGPQMQAVQQFSSMTVPTQIAHSPRIVYTHARPFYNIATMGPPQMYPTFNPKTTGLHVEPIKFTKPKNDVEDIKTAAEQWARQHQFQQSQQSQKPTPSAHQSPPVAEPSDHPPPPPSDSFCSQERQQIQEMNSLAKKYQEEDEKLNLLDTERSMTDQESNVCDKEDFQVKTMVDSENSQDSENVKISSREKSNSLKPIGYEMKLHQHNAVEPEKIEQSQEFLSQNNSTASSFNSENLDQIGVKSQNPAKDSADIKSESNSQANQPIISNQSRHQPNPNVQLITETNRPKIVNLGNQINNIRQQLPANLPIIRLNQPPRAVNLVNPVSGQVATSGVSNTLQPAQNITYTNSAPMSIQAIPMQNLVPMHYTSEMTTGAAAQLLPPGTAVAAAPHFISAIPVQLAAAHPRPIFTSIQPIQQIQQVQNMSNNSPVQNNSQIIFNSPSINILNPHHQGY